MLAHIHGESGSTPKINAMKNMRKQHSNSARASALPIALSVALTSVWTALLASSFTLLAGTRIGIRAWIVTPGRQRISRLLRLTSLEQRILGPVALTILAISLADIINPVDSFLIMVFWMSAACSPSS